MTIFSGRIDQIDDELSHIIHFTHILEHFDCTGAILAFEDKTKIGLSCKPHFHFLFESDYKHDAIRRFMSKIYDLKGVYSSLKETDNYDKAAVYTLKQYKHQQYVPFSDLDEDALQRYIDMSANYNDSIKLNSWPEHLEEIVKRLKEIPAKEDDIYHSRLTIYRYIIKYLWNWNKTEGNRRLDLPHNLKKSVNYIEEMILPYEAFEQRFLADNDLFIYKVEAVTKHGTKMLIKSHAYYDEESDDDIDNIPLNYYDNKNEIIKNI